jgi:Tfp pilus assembly protein PilF
MDRELFDAYHNGDIVPLVELNRLFRSSRILFGYYQGGLVVEYLAERFGFDKVVELVKGYGDDRSTEDLMQAVFGLPPAEFDQLFLKWVRDEKLKGMKLVPAFGDAAVERLRDRVTRDPNDIDTHVDLGWAYLRRGIAVDAANEVRIAMRADPEHGRALLLHAEMLRQRGAVDEAAEAYRRGFAAGADDFDSRIRFGQLLAAQDDIDGAVEQYQRAKTCWPQCTDRNVAPNLLLAALLRRVGRETEAMMELEAYVQRTGRAFAPRLELAAMEAENGNREEEVELLTEAIEIDPFMREAHVRLGDALEALQRKREALREFRMALAVPTELDRAHLGKPKSEIPDPTTMDERIARAEICVRIAKLHHALGDGTRGGGQRSRRRGAQLAQRVGSLVVAATRRFRPRVDGLFAPVRLAKVPGPDAGSAARDLVAGAGAAAPARRGSGLRRVADRPAADRAGTRRLLSRGQEPGGVRARAAAVPIAARRGAVG